MLESRCLWQRERNRYILLIIDFVDIIIAAIIDKLRKRKRMCNFFRIFVTAFFSKFILDGILQYISNILLDV